MSSKTKTQLVNDIVAKIITGGRLTTAQNVREVLNDVLDSYPNIVDGGLVHQAVLGYSSLINLSAADQRSFVHKDYVDSASSGLVVGTSPVLNATNGYVLYNNNGTLGELATTGSGNVVLSTSPTFVTDITTPLIIGGSAVGSKIKYTGSTNATPTLTGIAHEFYVGNNGGSEALRILHNKYIGIGTNPTYQLSINGSDTATDGILLTSTGFALVPNPGSVSNATVINARGYNMATDSITLGATYQPTLGIGLAANRSGGLLGIKNTNAAGYSILIEDGNMGIFTINPYTELQVSGNITTTWANSNIGTWYQDGTQYKMGFNTVIANRQLNLHAYTADTGGYITFSNGSVGSPLERMRVGVNGNVSIGDAALATTATDGFLYITSCAGVPTGVPTAITGRIPLVVDSTNNRMYIYSGGAWVALN